MRCDRKCAALGGAALLAIAPPVGAHESGLLSPYVIGTLSPGSLIEPGSTSGSSDSHASVSSPSNLSGGLDIVINPSPALAGNTAALAAFNRAAAQWEARIADPITVTINASLAPLGLGILGSTSPLALQGPYDLVRDQMVVDSLADTGDGVVALLPTAAQFNAVLPPGRSLDGNLVLTKANAKALGFTDLDALFGVSDGNITFSSNFSFDYDNSDGVSFLQTDFETVAAHEIGHLLGFISAVDQVNFGVPTFGPFTLDLFRFADNVAGQDPAGAVDFTTFPRNLVPGVTTVTDDLLAEYLMSTGLTNAGFPGTDGRQASHWKDDERTGSPGPLIGLMDPSLSPGGSFAFPSVELVMESDFRAMDLIGYDVVPEPASAPLLIASSALIGLRRRRAVRCRA